MTARLLWEVYSRDELADMGVTDLPETEDTIWISFSEPRSGPLVLLGYYIAPAEDGGNNRKETDPSVPSP